ncbi:MAG: hypothetical protein KKC37_17000 [Proteobacteria bacterium]|nr:hypothetical protein [Pseudomonadota bacterium]
MTYEPVRSWFTQEIAQTATTLLMVGPSRDFAAGVVAMASAMGAATPAMVEIIKSRWPEWTVIE